MAGGLAAGVRIEPLLRLAGAGEPAATDGDTDTAEAKVSAAAASINQMMDDSKLALATLSDEATLKTDKIVGTLQSIGIQPKLPAADDISAIVGLTGSWITRVIILPGDNHPNIA